MSSDTIISIRNTVANKSKSNGIPNGNNVEVDEFNFEDDGMQKENTVIVKVGDWSKGEKNSTLWDIAKNYGVSVDELMAANPQIAANGGIYHPGDEIVVPILTSPTESVVQTASLQSRRCIGVY